MSVLTKDQILGAKDTKTESVDVPEWGGEVLVKVMTGLERDAFEKSITETRGGSVTVNVMNYRAKLAARTICDETGLRLFEDKDIEALGKKSSLALVRVVEVAQRINCLGAKDVEDLTAKNSQGGQSEESTSS